MNGILTQIIEALGLTFDPMKGVYTQILEGIQDLKTGQQDLHQTNGSYSVDEDSPSIILYTAETDLDPAAFDFDDAVERKFYHVLNLSEVASLSIFFDSELAYTLIPGVRATFFVQDGALIKLHHSQTALPV